MIVRCLTLCPPIHEEELLQGGKGHETWPLNLRVAT